MRRSVGRPDAGGSATPWRSLGRFCCGVALLGCLGLLPRPAAAVTENRKKAEQLFLQGVGSFRANDLPGAAKQFEAALLLDRSPVLLYNLAAVYDKAKDVPAAVKYYKEYLKTEPPDATFVRMRLGQLDPAAVAAVEREIEAARAVAAAGGKGEPGDPGAKPVVPTAPVDKPGDGSTGKIQWTTWAVLGAGAVALAAGGTFGMLSSGAVDDFNSAKLRADATDAKSRAESHALVANVGLGVGAVAVVGGVVLLVRDLTGGGAKEDAPAAGSGGELGLGVSRWTVTPRLGPGELGFGLGRSF